MTKKACKDFPGELRKRIKQLEASRDRWKEDHKKDQIKKKRLREKVKDEIERRDRWKNDYQASKRKAYLLEEKVDSLYVDLESEKKEKEELRKKLEEIKKNSRDRTDLQGGRETLQGLQISNSSHTYLSSTSYQCFLYFSWCISIVANHLYQLFIF